MSKSATYEKKMTDLQAQIDKVSKKASGSSSSNMILIAIGIAVPIVIGGILFFVQPKFVQSQSQGGKYVRSNTKVILWTTVMTLLIWAAIYGYIYFSKNGKKE